MRDLAQIGFDDRLDTFRAIGQTNANKQTASMSRAILALLENRADSKVRAWHGLNPHTRPVKSVLLVQFLMIRLLQLSNLDSSQALNTAVSELFAVRRHNPHPWPP